MHAHSNNISNAIKNDIDTRSLLTAFDEISHQIKVLSLDCFDTLLWRTTAAPMDVFYGLSISPALRLKAEEKTRALHYIQQASLETDLNDIYKFAVPYATSEDRQAMIEAELVAEMEACYAFPPVVELIRFAYAQNKKIIVVSDTYFTKDQLYRLLSHQLPTDVMSYISDIFCSVDYGTSKPFGLFNKVIHQLKISSHSILHIGDNLLADKEAPFSVGMQAWQLMPFTDHLTQISNMHIWSASFIDQDVRCKRPLQYPFRGLFGIAAHTLSSPESVIGYMTAGPIMFAFAKYIEIEIEKLKQQYANVKVLFLMRDAYLPFLVCQKLLGENAGQLAHISRFTTYAASFRHKKDIEAYFSEVLYSGRFEQICRQLLLPDEMADNILSKIKDHPEPNKEFANLIYQDYILNTIIEQSKVFRERLICYLKKELKIESEDHLVFIDLGYSGTTQLILSPILNECGMTTSGRYLLALETPKWPIESAGLLDASWCDSRMLSMFVNYIALFEQICTIDQGSVIDYTPEGSPIFSNSNLLNHQHSKLSAIQAECLRFIEDSQRFIADTKLTLPLTHLRDVARADLARFLFLPTANEMQYLQDFQFDFNLGTDKKLPIFDTKKGEENLRQRGLFFMERNLETMRTNYPAELRAISLDLSFTLMALERYKGKLSVQDFSFRREKINIILISREGSTQNTLEAFPTYDGYYSLIIPLGNGSFQVGIQFGLLYRWFELDCAQLISSQYWLTHKESEHTQQVTSALLLSHMQQHDECLYECKDKTSLIAYVPTRSLEQDHQLLRIIFRPIKRR